jgi:hypothetical protein
VICVKVTVWVAGKFKIEVEPVMVAVPNVTEACVNVTDEVPIILVDPVITAVPKVTGACVKVTACVAGKLRIEVEPVITAVPKVTEGVPEILAVTDPICAVPAPIVTPCVAICVKVTDGVPMILVEPVITAVPKVTEACENVTD